MPYRTTRGCPVCGSRLSSYRTRDYSYERCNRCLGVWMSIALLSTMCAEILPERALYFEPSSAGRPRSCPDCQQQMRRAFLFEIPIDWCAARSDGIWLDKDELSQVLARVAESDPPPPDPPTSFTSLLSDFFAQRNEG